MKQDQNPNLCLHSAEPCEDTPFTKTRTNIYIYPPDGHYFIPLWKGEEEKIL